MPSITNKLKEKWQLIIYVSVVLGAFSFFISTLMPFYFRSEMVVLIVPQNQEGNQASSRSVSYQSEILSRIIYSDVFMKKVAETPWVLEDDFPFDDKERIDFWKKRVVVEKKRDLGILKIFVFERSREGAENLALGIREAILKEGEEYFSQNNGIEIHLIGEPLTSSQPVKPNIFLNAFLGFWVGLLGSIFLVFVFDDFNLKVFERKTVLAGKEQDKIKKRLQKELEYSKRKEDLSKEKSLEDNYFALFSKNHKKEQSIFAKIQNLPSKTEKEDEDSKEGKGREEKSKLPDETEKSKATSQQAVAKEQDVIESENKISSFKPADFNQFEQKEKITEEKKSSRGLELENEEEKKEIVFSENDQLKKEAYWPKTEEAVFTKENTKKAAAPENLPIFIEEDENDFRVGGGTKKEKFQKEFQNSRDFSQKETKNDISSERNQAISKKTIEGETDATEEEVKEKLNKLLRGEL